MKFDYIKNILIDPETKNPLKYENNYFASESNKYFVENDIISIYLKMKKLTTQQVYKKNFMKM